MLGERDVARLESQQGKPKDLSSSPAKSEEEKSKSKSIVSIQDEIEPSAPIMKNFWSKNRLIAIFVSLAVVIVILFSVCIYQATTTSGRIYSFN